MDPSTTQPGRATIDGVLNIPSQRQLVLVVDDDWRFANTISAALQVRGFDVATAYDGNVGLAMAIVKRPELLILDSLMPKRSGYLVLEYLHTKTDFDSPVILLSDNEGERHRNYANLLGVQAIFEKPVNTSQLVACVTSTMEEVSQRPRKMGC